MPEVTHNQAPIDKHRGFLSRNRRLQRFVYVLGLTIAMFTVSIGIYSFIYRQSDNYIIVQNQELGGVIRIREVKLHQDGFVLVRPVGRYPAFVYTATSEYLKAGTYHNLEIPYSQLLMGKDLAGSSDVFEAGIYLPEQLDGLLTVGSFEKPVMDLFQRPAEKKFRMTNAPIRKLMCSNGFSDSFSSSEIDASLWQWTIGASSNQDLLLQTDKNTKVEIFIPHEFEGRFRQTIDIASFEPLIVSSEDYGANMMVSFVSERVGFGWRWEIGTDGPHIQAFVRQNGETEEGEKIPVTFQNPTAVEIIRDEVISSIRFVQGENSIVLWEGQLPQENVVLSVSVLSPSDKRYQLIRARLDNFTFGCP